MLSALFVQERLNEGRAELGKISIGSVHTVFLEHLVMRKLLSRWIPRLLIFDQKQEPVEDSERCLELFKRNKKNLPMRYVTMDELCIITLYSSLKSIVS